MATVIHIIAAHHIAILCFISCGFFFSIAGLSKHPYLVTLLAGSHFTCCGEVRGRGRVFFFSSEGHYHLLDQGVFAQNERGGVEGKGVEGEGEKGGGRY